MLAGQDSTPAAHCFASSATFRLSKRTVCPPARISVTAACPTTPVPPVTNTFIVNVPCIGGYTGRLGANRRDGPSLDLVPPLTTSPRIRGKGELLSKAVSSLALLALAACGGLKEPYVVGAAGPWKQGYGLQNLQGVQLAAEEINKAGGINGHPFQLVTRDDEGDGTIAAKVAQEFVRN